MGLVASQINAQLDREIPVASVVAQTHAFLERCGWTLEIDNEIVEIPRDVKVFVRSRAFVKAEQGDVFLGDHFEAVVLIGKRLVDEDLCASHAVLKLYFNLEGQLVSEDRYDQYK